MPRLTKKLVSEIAKWTETCYKQTLKAQYPNIFEVWELDKLTSRLMKEICDLAGEPYRSEEIDRDYLERVCKLSNKQLDLIIEAHLKKKLIRASSTIDRIMTELLERELDQERYNMYNSEEQTARRQKNKNGK